MYVLLLPVLHCAWPLIVLCFTTLLTFSSFTVPHDEKTNYVKCIRATILYSHHTCIPFSNEQISIVFDSNLAFVGAAIYTSNAALCSWLRLREPFFNTTEFYRIPALKYRYSMLVNEFMINMESVYPGTTETLPIYLRIMKQNGMCRPNPSL